MSIKPPVESRILALIETGEALLLNFSHEQQVAMAAALLRNEASHHAGVAYPTEEAFVDDSNRLMDWAQRNGYTAVGFNSIVLGIAFRIFAQPHVPGKSEAI